MCNEFSSAPNNGYPYLASGATPLLGFTDTGEVIQLKFEYVNGSWYIKSDKNGNQNVGKIRINTMYISNG